MQNSKFKFFLLIFMIAPLFSGAAEFSFTKSQGEIRKGDQFEVILLVSSLEEEINTLGGTLLYQSEVLFLKEIREGNSLVSLWLEKPQETEAGSILFSGIIPGGYQGGPQKVFSVIFEAKKTGRANIFLDREEIFRNDGQGGKASVKKGELSVQVAEATGEPRTILLTDTEPPESFQPEVASDPELFDGQYFIVFTTQDKNSGISRYEVSESKKKKIGSSEIWESAESPYLLKDQSLESYIHIKAFDKAGNYKIVSLSPSEGIPTYERASLWLIIVISIATCYLIWRKYFQKSS